MFLLLVKFTLGMLIGYVLAAAIYEAIIFTLKFILRQANNTLNKYNHK